MKVINIKKHEQDIYLNAFQNFVRNKEYIFPDTFSDRLIK
jgi:hypothetical protein